MKPLKSRRAELPPNAMGGGKSHAESAEISEFKMTELGPIPVDWEVKRIDQCGDVVTGSTPPRGVSELWEGSFNWISAKDFKGKYIVSSEEKVTEAGKRYCRTLPANSVLVTCIASIGLNAIAKLPCATNQQINAIVCRDCDYEYFYYQCCFNESRLRQLAGQTAVPIIGKSQFKEFTIALPNEIKEQRRIAGALSDVDELISALGKLIEKKRNIKTGTMQQLLTGKTRLPGFKGKWVEKRLGECATIKARIGWQGLTVEEYLDTGDYCLIGGSNFEHGSVLWDTCPYVSQERYNQDKFIQVHEGDVLVSKDGTIGKVAFVNSLPRPSTLNSGVFVVRSIDVGLAQSYLARVFLSKWFEGFIDRITAGSTIVHLYQKDIVDFSFLVPPTLAEQKAIAAVLSDMDAEIAALEADRAKYERIKSGMMQELLTGRTRLKGE